MRGEDPILHFDHHWRYADREHETTHSLESEEVSDCRHNINLASRVTPPTWLAADKAATTTPSGDAATRRHTARAHSGGTRFRAARAGMGGWCVRPTHAFAGVTKFGQSGYRDDLYRYFHIDAQSIIKHGFELVD